MIRVWLAAAVFVLLVWPSPATAVTREELLLPMDDGVTIAATLAVPSAAPPPATGWPAVVLMHGLGGERSSMTTLAERMGLVGEEFVVLTFDARGHGQSGGLIGIDGPREIADVRVIFALLAARPDVADARIGAFGISYGGGAALNSLAAGVPWAALEVAETWSDLTSALLPQGLAKSGVIAGFLSGLPATKLDPTVTQVRDAAFSGTNLAFLRDWGAKRSSLPALRGVRTPIFFMQGRRDFAFGLDQAIRAYEQLAGPKRLWIGNHGHPPSTFPAVDSAKMLAEGKLWFDRFLRGAANGIDRKQPVVVAAEGSAATRSYDRVPATRGVTLRRRLPRAATVTPVGKVVVDFRSRAAFELFRAPTVRVTASSAGGWSRVVAVLSARLPGGKEIVLGGGGVPARPGQASYRIALNDAATVVPAGSTLRVTIGSSSLAQNAANLLYLDLPLPPAARLSVRQVGVDYRTRPRWRA
jgi:predicted acyl esterase